jgi:hypothetical protein
LQPIVPGAALILATRSATVFTSLLGLTSSRKAPRLSWITGASTSGSSACFWKYGLVTSAGTPKNNVVPSGALRETCSIAMLPPAPGLYSTMTVVPR